VKLKTTDRDMTGMCSSGTVQMVLGEKNLIGGKTQKATSGHFHFSEFCSASMFL
jgi:hypothetical protein